MQRLSSALADRYVIERELGAGGMATVYLAHDVRHDRKVALKVLRPELSAILGGERFLAEIKTTANLQHPHILSLFDSGEADGLVFYVMPYVEGESLRDRLTREKQLPVDEAVRIAREVADALEYAHQHGIVHRDIKPENILLHGGHAQVADFGIALAASRGEGGTRMTETGMSLGTPHYMSPEQSMGEREITPKADIYALGCVLYEMLTAEPPFTGATAQAIIARVMTEEPRSLTLQRKSIPPHVEAAVERALEKLPADRWASAAQFGEALQGGGPGDRGTGRPRMAGSSRPAVPRSRGPAVLLPWALAALALAVAAWALLRPRPSSLAAVTRLLISLPDSAPLRTQFGILFALSDDGSQIVYVGPGQGDIDLWSRPLNSLVATRIPGTNGGDSPFLSPAGDVVAFYRNTPNAVFTVSLRGGPRQTIATDSMVALGGDFGPDGAIYFTRRGGIRRLPRGGRVVEQVTTVDTAAGESGHAWVDVLPSGRGALFTIGRARPDEYDIAVVNFKSHEVKVLTRGIYARYASSGHVVYATSDGGLYALAFDQGSLTTSGAVIPVLADVAREAGGVLAHFAISATGTLLYGRALAGATGDRLEWVDRSGRAEVVDTSVTGALVDVALSPDGRRLAMTKTDDEGRNVWVKELDHGPMSRLSLGAPPSYSAGWTPDGRSVLYVTQPRAGGRAVFVRRADGSAPAESLLASSRSISYAAESRDGQWIVYQAGAGAGPTGRDLFARRLHGDTTLLRLAESTAREEAPRLSPDGRWLAYLSNESGRSEVYVRPFPNTAASRTQVSVDGGYEPLWSPNGRELFYTNEDDMLFAARVESSPAFRVLARDRLFDRSPYNDNTDGAPAYDITPDGRRFIMMRAGRTSGMQLVLVLNFFADLAPAGR